MCLLSNLLMDCFDFAIIRSCRYSKTVAYFIKIVSGTDDIRPRKSNGKVGGTIIHENKRCYLGQSLILRSCFLTFFPAHLCRPQ